MRLTVIFFTGIYWGMLKLQTYLKDSGLTQAEFAAKVGVKQGTISRLVNGSRAPSLVTAMKIAKVTRGKVPVTAWGDLLGVAA